MTLIDANVLLYAVNRSDPQHGVASSWLERVLNGVEALGLPWVTILAFLRLSTGPHVFPSPLSVDAAHAVVDALLARRSVVVPLPTPRHLQLLHSLLTQSGTAGNLVADAHLAALAIEHSARIASFDRDFLRFGGIQLLVPQ